MSKVRRKLGEILQGWGLVTDEQIANAMKMAEGSRKRIGEVLIELDYVSESDVAKALANQFNMEYIDLDEPKNNRRESSKRACYEDTIRVPQRPGLVLGRSYTVMRLAVRFDDAHRPVMLRRRAEELIAGGLHPSRDGSGGWLVHCHFLEHSRKGMMSFITVRR